MAVFAMKEGLNVSVVFLTFKSTSLPVDLSCVKIRSEVWAVWPRKEPQNDKKNPSKHDAQSRACVQTKPLKRSL